MSFLLLPNLGQGTLADYMAYLDYIYEAEPSDGWRPSEWLTFLAHWDAPPNWQVELVLSGPADKPLLQLWFTAYVGVGNSLEPLRLGARVVVLRRQIIDARGAANLVRSTLREMANDFVREAFTVDPRVSLR